MYVLVLFVAVASAGGVGGGPSPKGLKVFDAVSVGLMLFSELMILKLSCSQDVRTVGQRRIGKAVVIFPSNVKWLMLVLILPCLE